jgi:hypothetical protein
MELVEVTRTGNRRGRTKATLRQPMTTLPNGTAVWPLDSQQTVTLSYRTAVVSPPKLTVSRFHAGRQRTYRRQTLLNLLGNVRLA